MKKNMSRLTKVLPVIQNMNQMQLSMRTSSSNILRSKRDLNFLILRCTKVIATTYPALVIIVLKVRSMRIRIINPSLIARNLMTLIDTIENLIKESSLKKSYFLSKLVTLNSKIIQPFMRRARKSHPSL